MSAKALRAQARAALRGKWGLAVGVGLVASLLTGGYTVSGGGSAGAEGYLGFTSHAAMITTLTALVAGGLLAVLIGGAIQLGWSDFNIRLIKKQEVRFGMLFGHFHRLWTGICMNVVMTFFVVLWSMLLIVPGVIAAYRYAMVPYLLAEFPDLRVMDAMRESKRLMRGNKWRLFCLELSFLGWGLLGAITVVGTMWVAPYLQAAHAAFYMDVTGRGPVQPQYESLNQNNGPEL